ncbi:MAG: hypothetical protein PWP50_964, partial [Synergistaceae bacterium]|nr:hypothetical protein [Synergistaceae bacterium]
VRLSMQARREIIWKESKGYNKLSKKEKMARLDSVVAVTGYNRTYSCGFFLSKTKALT